MVHLIMQKYKAGTCMTAASGLSVGTLSSLSQLGAEQGLPGMALGG